MLKVGSGGNCSRLNAIFSNSAESIDNISDDRDVCERSASAELVEGVKLDHVVANPVDGVIAPDGVAVDTESSQSDSI